MTSINRNETHETSSIQGDAVGEVNVLGDDLVVVRKKVRINMCLELNGYRDRAV
jgi:hypothetical protein